MFADTGYQGAENREELADVKAEWAIAMRLGKFKELKKHPRKKKQSLPLRSSSPAFAPRWNTRSGSSNVNLAL